MIIFGDKTVALLDLWNIEHFLTGCNSIILIDFLVRKISPENKDFKLRIIFLFALEVYWEVIEYYLEDGISYDAVTYWFQGVEYVGNRLISDPIVTCCGLIFIKKFPNFRWLSAILSIIWLYLNLIVFDNCMQLQEVFFPYTLEI